jgi:YVTN family beta-propeller protein
VNQFIGDDPQGWRSGIPTYGEVRIRGVYPGIDLVYYSVEGRLEYDFVVAAGANPRAIALRVKGADKLEIDRNGDLVVRVRGGEMKMGRPVVYQMVDGRRQEIAGHFRLRRNGRVGFQVATYDAGKPLIIDPVLHYSTYLGGSSFDSAYGIGLDAAGNAYVAGLTGSFNFPTKAAFQPSSGAPYDAFVAKFDPDGTLVYSTFLGGNDYDDALGIAVDRYGQAHVTGQTSSRNFPVVAPAQGHLAGFVDAWVAKLDPKGVPIYSTYLGGKNSEVGRGIAVDPAGNAYVTGGTDSVDFPAENAIMPWSGWSDVFVARFDPKGGLTYSTYFGGSDFDMGRGIAADGDGNMYVVGDTSSPDFPTLGSPQPFGGWYDAFVFKLDRRGQLVYSTLLGGPSYDVGRAIAVDRSGDVWVTGATFSSNFPTLNAVQATLNGSFDAFVAKLDRFGSALYSTYLGGTGGEYGLGIAVDIRGNAYVTGTTTSFDFPTLRPSQATFGGSSTDAFVTKFDGSGRLVYSTYLGGSGADQGFGIAVDAEGAAHVAGDTYSVDFPTVQAFQPGNAGALDAFVTKIVDVFAYATNYWGPDLSMIDTASNAVSSIPVGGGGAVGVAVTPDGGRAYLANEWFNAVVVVDTFSQAVLAFVPVGLAPQQVAITPDGAFAYVTNFWVAAVSVIDTAANVVAAKIPVGDCPAGIAITPDGSRAYVADFCINAVSVIDTASQSELARVGVGASPWGVAISPDGSWVYVTNSGSSPGSVSVIDTFTDKVIATVQVGGRPRGIATAPLGLRAYVANSSTNDVSVIDGITNSVVASVAVGAAPEAVAVTPGGTRVYVTNSSSNSVSVIDTASNGVVATVPVSLYPRGIAISR